MTVQLLTLKKKNNVSRCFSFLYLLFTILRGTIKRQQIAKMNNRVAKERQGNKWLYHVFLKINLHDITSKF